MSDKIAVAYIHPGTLSAPFVQSLLDLVTDDMQRGDKARIGRTINLSSGPRIAHARNQVVNTFLKDTTCDWLLMVDTDMVFTPKDVDDLLEVAQKSSRPAIGGLCFGGGRGRVFPTLYRLRKTTEENPDPVEVIEDYPADAVVKVDATGAAFLLIHRGVLKLMGTKFALKIDDDGNYVGPSPWFIEGSSYKGMEFGEDWAFCMRLKEMGVDVFVHTGVKIGHVKPAIIDEAAFFEYRAKRDNDRELVEA